MAASIQQGLHVARMFMLGSLKECNFKLPPFSRVLLAINKSGALFRSHLVYDTEALQIQAVLIVPFLQLP